MDFLKLSSSTEPNSEAGRIPVLVSTSVLSVAAGAWVPRRLMLPGAGSTVPRLSNQTSVTGCHTVGERPPRSATGEGCDDATDRVAGTNADSLYGWVGMMTPSSHRPTDLPGAEGLAGKLSTLALMPSHLAPGSHRALAAEQ